MARRGSSTSEAGELVELRFCIEAYNRGFEVCKPFGHNCRYDFIVDGPNGLWRVQVKSTKSFQSSSRAYKVVAGYGSKSKEPYTKNDIDVLVAYVSPENLWYIIPVEEIAGRLALALFAHNSRSSGKWEKYRECWDLF